MNSISMFQRAMLIIVIVVGTFCMILNQSILTTAFPSLMKTFSVDTTTVQWLTTGFMLVNGIMIPVSAWLTGRFNTKWLYIFAMLVFELGTVVAYLSINFTVLLIGRVVQAVGVGIAIPLYQNIMLAVFPPEKRGSAMGTAGIAIGLAPAFGPTISGFVIDNSSWRNLFGLLIPITFVIIVLGIKYLRPVLDTSKLPLDATSLILSMVGCGSLLYGISILGNKGFEDSLVLVTVGIGIICIYLFSLRQKHLTVPFLDLSVLKTKNFIIAVFMVSLVYTAMFSVEIILPLYLQNVRHFSALNSGIILLGGAVMMSIMTPVTGRIFDKYGARSLTIVGFSLLTLGTIPFIIINLDTGILLISLTYAIRMLGISMIMMPITAYGMNALPENMLRHGTAVLNTIKQIVGSLVTSLMISILAIVSAMKGPDSEIKNTNPLKYQEGLVQAKLMGFSSIFIIATIAGIAGIWIAVHLKKDIKKEKQN